MFDVCRRPLVFCVMRDCYTHKEKLGKTLYFFNFNILMWDSLSVYMSLCYFIQFLYSVLISVLFMCIIFMIYLQKLGVPLEGKVRVQLNFKNEHAENIQSVQDFRDFVFPIMWLEEVT